MSNTAMTERIRKLLAKAAADGVSPEEAESLRSKAFELAAKHEVDIATAVASGESKKDKIVMRSWSIPRPYVQRIRLANAVYQQFCGCKLVQVSGEKGLVYAFGYESDMQRAEVLLTSIELQGISELKITEIPFGEVPRTFRRAWWGAFATRIYRRLSEIKQGVAPSVGSGTEIALRDKSLEVANAATKYFGQIRPGRRSSVRKDSYGRSLGDEAGRRINLGSGEVGGPGPKALG